MLTLFQPLRHIKQTLILKLMFIFIIHIMDGNPLMHNMKYNNWKINVYSTMHLVLRKIFYALFVFWGTDINFGSTKNYQKCSSLNNIFQVLSGLKDYTLWMAKNIGEWLMSLREPDLFLGAISTELFGCQDLPQASDIFRIIWPAKYINHPNIWIIPLCAIHQGFA